MEVVTTFAATQWAALNAAARRAISFSSMRGIARVSRIELRGKPWKGSWGRRASRRPESEKLSRHCGEFP